MKRNMLDYNDIERDKNLFRQMANGDQRAFTILFNNYVNPLYWNAYKLLQSEFWAEEVVQLVFAQLWANRQNLSHVQAPASYLYRMVTNKARDRMRKQAREIKMQYWLEAQAEKNLTEQQFATNQDDLFLLLEKAVNELPHKRKQVYIMKYHDRLSYEEIAEKLNLSRFSVRNHMSLALEDIRAYLLEHGDLIGFLLWLYFF